MGLISGSIFVSLQKKKFILKISKINFKNSNLKISNSRIQKKNSKEYRNIFDPFARKIVIQNLRHDSALSLFFPPKHIDLGCPPCPWGCPTTASAYTVRIFGFGLPVLEIQEVILCVICVFIQNLSFLRGQLPIRQTLWISRLFS